MIKKIETFEIRKTKFSRTTVEIDNTVVRLREWDNPKEPNASSNDVWLSAYDIATIALVLGKTFWDCFAYEFGEFNREKLRVK